MTTMEQIDTSYLMTIIGCYKYIISHQTWMGQFNTYNSPYCEENKAGERTSILDTFSTEYTQQAFMHASRFFHVPHVCNASE